MKKYTLSFIIKLAVFYFALLGVSLNVIALDKSSRTLFSAPTTQSNATSEPSDQAAYLLGTFELPDSRGQISFVDEAPHSASPEISVVVIEDAEFNTLALAMGAGTSIVDLFSAYAPKKTPVPERLKLADEKMAERQGTQRHKPQTFSSMHVNAVPSEPEVEPDDWASGCNDTDNWENEFASWVGSFAFPSPATSSQTSVVDIPDETQGYGYFGYMDNIWAGVCMRSGEIMHVGIQFKNHNGIWVTIGGWGSTLTTADLHPGERYLYHSFKPFTGPRRIYVSATGNAPDDNGNWAIISNAWRDDFKPDGTYAYP